jgi:hypothetical protein
MAILVALAVHRYSYRNEPDKRRIRIYAGALTVSLLLARNMQRAYASPADRVRRDVECGPKAQRLRTIYNLAQRLIVNVPQRRMKKAGTDLAGCFDH